MDTEEKAAAYAAILDFLDNLEETPMPEELAEQLRPGCGDVRTAGSPRQALRLAEELAHGGDLLVAGSFFLAAELRPLLLLAMREGRLS